MASELATSSIEPFLKGETARNTRGLLRIIILCTIAAAAVASRLFSVIRMFCPVKLGTVAHHLHLQHLHILDALFVKIRR